MSNYLVRQYRPAYFSGFEDAVYSGVPEGRWATVPFFKNFMREGFSHFEVTPYGSYCDPPELIIDAHYTNGEHWVVAFAILETAPFASDWRYKGAKPYTFKTR